MADELAPLEQAPATELARVELAQARARLSHAARGLKADLQWLKVPDQVKTSIDKYPLLWVGGAFAVGAVLGTLFSRRDDGTESTSNDA